MRTYIKAQFSSVIAFGVDFVVTIAFTELFQVWYLAASMVGSVAGAITHFTLGRGWVFDGAGKKIPMQALKYLVLWNGHILLTTLGIYLLTSYALVNYALSKIIVSVLMGLTYSYIMQRNFVFK
ncbi:MAG TPA: GtrA family protein [Cyclobacteriaceae bacterium]|jgi:putative flippase GtrA|nr:GtrA family protein [Cyclobacteriaceae bacterium]